CTRDRLGCGSSTGPIRTTSPDPLHANTHCPPTRTHCTITGDHRMPQHPRKVRKMATVTFDKALRQYPEALAPSVDEISLDIADGEFLVLVGPSGCGKSTTLRMLAGLEPVDAGRIRIGEDDVTQLSPRERDIA